MCNKFWISSCVIFMLVQLLAAEDVADFLSNPNLITGSFSTSQTNVSAGCTEDPTLPCKSVLIFAPTDKKTYPVAMFQHGFVLRNEFYTDLLSQVASRGFIVIAPQMYWTWGGIPLKTGDATEEISDATAVLDWAAKFLHKHLDSGITPDFKKLALLGHSRGGKVAVALAQQLAKSSNTAYSLKALAALDPVDGAPFGVSPDFPWIHMDCYNGIQTDPKLVNNKLAFGVPALFLGTGLGPKPRLGLLCPCAPSDFGYSEFYKSTDGEAYTVNAQDFGHMDIIDQEVGNAATVVCRGTGKQDSRPVFRSYAARFLGAYLQAVLADSPKVFCDMMSKGDVGIDIVDKLRKKGASGYTIKCPSTTA